MRPWAVVLTPKYYKRTSSVIWKLWSYLVKLCYLAYLQTLLHTIIFKIFLFSCSDTCIWQIYTVQLSEGHNFNCMRQICHIKKKKKERKHLHFSSILTYCMHLGCAPFSAVLFVVLHLALVQHNVAFQYVFIVTYVVILLKILRKWNNYI